MEGQATPFKEMFKRFPLTTHIQIIGTLYTFDDNVTVGGCEDLCRVLSHD
jgi:hypothetical protein